ncbi:hypothetical protein BJ165DRAFT_1303625, partial [Panaeolus papilionaceus]
GCRLMREISEALITVKGISTGFGGVNIIFAGDFAQLPPVGDPRLSGHVDMLNASSVSKKGQNRIDGRLLWLSINCVVILTESMCQSGLENAHLVDLLSCLRDGQCTYDDYDLLMSQCLPMSSIDWSQWRDAPIIVSDNVQKDALNEKATHAFASRTGRDLHYYYSLD